MKKRIICVLVACLMCLSGCSLIKGVMNPTPLSQDEAREEAFNCFAEHKEDMEEIIKSQDAMGETYWCSSYDKGKNGTYSFNLQRTGFTTMTATGVRYDPSNQPGDNYLQDEENPNGYIYKTGVDRHYLERIEDNWFFFYSVYDL